ncbi:MAG: hypothetical protein IT531_19055 [Burkholderiales bacterium]|nr:hypothetical protein [Burkholderiales bacterium]
MRKALSVLLVICAYFVLLSASALAQSELSRPVVPRPKAGSYVVARDGQFFLENSRIRFWGFNVQAAAHPSKAEMTQLAERLALLGINSVRLWPGQGTFYSAASARARSFVARSVGDGSLLDRYDFLVSELKRNGIFIQNTGLHFVDIEAIAAWPDSEMRAILGPRPDPAEIRKLHGIAPYLSSGWESMLHAHIRNYLTHVNPYTGASYADEPIIAGWELANESGFMHCMLRKACVESLPVALRTLLEQQWVAYLEANGGRGVDRRLPVFEETWDRAASDVHASYREFVHNKFVETNRRLEKSARGMAPAGKGVAVQPFTYSTQAGDPLLVARAAHAAGDYSAIGAYQTPLSRARSNPFYPFRLHLSVPSYYNFNFGAVEGKPTVVYENSFFRPYPYRVEWAWALLYLAATQDWDGLYLYTLGQPWATYSMEQGTAEYGHRPLPIPTLSKGVDTGFHHGGDEVTVSSWVAAGLAFLNGRLPPARAATRFSFDAVHVFGPAPGYCEGPSGCAGGVQIVARMNEVSAQSAVRLAFPGSPALPATAKLGAESGSSMRLDRTVPRLVIDTPSAKAIVGVLEGRFQFEGGFAIEFSGRQFGFVSLNSADGRNLTESRNARLYSAGLAANTGFRFAPEKVDFGRATGVIAGVESVGSAPVLHDRVAFALYMPDSSRALRRFDFNLRNYRSEVSVRTITVDAEEPLFIGEIVR